MTTDDPNEIPERIAARFGRPATAIARAQLRALTSLASDVYEIEWHAERSGEADVLESATELRRQIEAGDLDSSLEVARTALGDLKAQLAAWETLNETDRLRINFVRKLREARRRTRGADFWPHAIAFAGSRDWGFGRGEPAIKKAVKVAECYGVWLDDLGPGKVRGRRR